MSHSAETIVYIKKKQVHDKMRQDRVQTESPSTAEE